MHLIGLLGRPWMGFLWTRNLLLRRSILHWKPSTENSVSNKNLKHFSLYQSKCYDYNETANKGLNFIFQGNLEWGFLWSRNLPLRKKTLHWKPSTETQFLIKIWTILSLYQSKCNSYNETANKGLSFNFLGKIAPLCHQQFSNNLVQSLKALISISYFLQALKILILQDRYTICLLLFLII